MYIVSWTKSSEVSFDKVYRVHDKPNLIWRSSTTIDLNFNWAKFNQAKSSLFSSFVIQIKINQILLCPSVGLYIVRAVGRLVCQSSDIFKHFQNLENMFYECYRQQSFF